MMLMHGKLDIILLLLPRITIQRKHFNPQKSQATVTTQLKRIAFCSCGHRYITPSQLNQDNLNIMPLCLSHTSVCTNINGLLQNLT